MTFTQYSIEIVKLVIWFRCKEITFGKACLYFSLGRLSLLQHRLLELGSYCKAFVLVVLK